MIPRVKRRAVLAVIVCAWFLLTFEIASAIRALRTRTTALQMLRAVDHFRLGATSKAEAESRLVKLGVTPEDEACSAPAGSCEGIEIVLSNYPRLPLNGDIAGIVDYGIGKISIFRPTYVVGNFYFYSDRLQSGGVSFSTDKASVGTEFASADPGEDAIPRSTEREMSGISGLWSPRIKRMHH